MLVRRYATRFRHIRHFTKFTHERERIGKSPYATHVHVFRHVGAMEGGAK